MFPSITATADAAALIPNVPQQASAVLNIPQQVGDLDMTTAIRDVIASHNLSAEALVVYDNSPLIIQSIGKNPAAQMWLQKEFWLYQLSLINGVNTMEDRVIIQQINDPVTWVQYFAKNVMDLARLHSLPRRHGW